MTKRQIEELLHHGSFLQWLARRLLRDAARADDAVQETWLAVLHSNKSPSEVSRGWLATVLRNLALRKLREERRRARREQIVARPHLIAPAPSRLDAEELRVKLAKLVLSLPEHYREALLLRYYEGLEPAEIATRTGVPASTVRTRIRRGLARIRHDLNGTTLSLAPLLQIIALGETSRRLGLVPLAAAGMVLVAAIVAFQGADAVSRASYTSARLAIGAETAYRESRPAPTLRTVEGKEIGDGTVRANPTPTLIGQVVLPHGVAHETAQLEVTAPARTAVVRTTVRSAFAVDLTPLFESGTPKSLRLVVTHPECETVTRVLASNTREITITLERRPLLAPELFAPTLPDAEEATEEPIADGAPQRAVTSVPSVYLHATVHLPDDMTAERVALSVCRGDHCLRFRIPAGRRVRVDVGALLTGSPAARLVVRAGSRHTVSVRCTIPIWSGPRLDPLVIRLERGRLVRGRVVWENGVAAADATVAAVIRKKPVVATTTDATGRFEFTLPDKRALRLLALASGAVPASAEPSADVRIVLRKGAVITGRVAPPAAQTRVHLFAGALIGGLETKYGTVAWAPNGPRWSAVSTRVDDRGTFRFAGLAVGGYTAQYANEKREVNAPGHVEFAPLRVPLTVITTNGKAPVADALVTVGDAVRRTDAHGRAMFTVFEGVDLAVRAEAKGYLPAKHVTQPHPELVMELTRADRFGRLDISVAANDAPLLASALVTLQAVDRQVDPVSRKTATNGGMIRIDALLPGTYEVVVDPGGWHFPVRTVATVIAENVTRVDLDPAIGGRIRAVLLDRFGSTVATKLLLEPATNFRSLAQLKQDDALSPSVPATAQPYTSGALTAPGHHFLWFVPGTIDAHPHVTSVEVVAGERTDVVLRE